MKRDSGISSRVTVPCIPAILLLLSVDVFAGMAVGPMQQWVEVKPGEEAFCTMTVKNPDRGPQTNPCVAYVNVVDFSVNPHGKLLFDQEHKDSRSAVDWISLDASRITLQPGESRELKLRVAAPANADGDYWAAITFTMGNSGNQKQSMNVNLRTACGVFVRVKRRNHIESTSIVDMNVTLPQFDLEQDTAEESTCDQTSQQVPTKCALKIDAELKNDGLTAITGNVKAILYSEDYHRIATIPLYASRRRVFPGHTRWFSGVMTQPLPVGPYKMRVFVNSDSKYSRTTTKDLEFSISEKVACQWSDNFKDDVSQVLKLKPTELDLTLNPGRFTTAKLLVENTSSSTNSVSCSLQTNEFHEDWIKLKTPQFTLAPNARRYVVCTIRIPPDAQQQDYDLTLLIESESSGLVDSVKSNVKKWEVPVHISINDYFAIKQ